ncbi:hypothetical protein J2T56_001969 [Natronobacillus azotifigens]|uniref:Uncharacterized protein n=1 Tax=Natronobacillus azotifigens TaxID=472978 RepID=A0A9J6RDR9_9BACI|nr:hypothetical protein [Natronobacillus azotifigens]MCZ0703816.1 hypothetical protein [Natronobacillus azotifigens]
MKKLVAFLFFIFIGLILVTGTWMYYRLSLINAETKDASVQEERDTEYFVSVPRLKESYKKNERQSNNTNVEQVDVINQTEDSPSPTINPVDEESASLPLENILQSYREEFSNLESKVTEKIEDIISIALTEYEDKKADGEQVSQLYFFQEYSSIATDLEKNPYGSFKKMYQALLNELQANN